MDLSAVQPIHVVVQTDWWAIFLSGLIGAVVSVGVAAVVAVKVLSSQLTEARRLAAEQRDADRHQAELQRTADRELLDQQLLAAREEAQKQRLLAKAADAIIALQPMSLTLMEAAGSYPAETLESAMRRLTPQFSLAFAMTFQAVREEGLTLQEEFLALRAQSIEDIDAYQSKWNNLLKTVHEIIGTLTVIGTDSW